ncbi:MAG: molybdenum cofactor guanylyltransferase [Armatimonadetes bacterium]|nr:molybdenum cofactor guanylyltransferase [Armatimonadota bacterium]
MVNDCAAVLLAGGQSSRMGRPKAWLEFGGRPLLAWLVERLLTVFPEALVVGAPGQDLPETPARVLRDEVPGQGPVGGLVVGLREAGHPFAFVASCDVPFLNPAVAEYLAHVCACYDVAVPEWEGRLHPVQAVYRTSVQPVLAEMLAAGIRRPIALFEQVRTCIVREEELRALDREGRTFLNVNTPEEYEAARREWDYWRSQ